MFKISLRFFLIFLDINRYAILQKSDIPISYKNVRLNWMIYTYRSLRCNITKELLINQLLFMILLRLFVFSIQFKRRFFIE